ncbi:DMT family transporter [Microaerobacter geothermalis]|uniref:DMT family transporter n=1 Tax=Microaerobacter geothermalis TaxID=674972 RepID=UPI001F2B3D7A|nr:DMT family transporter [Microaerobacter geothermalis]MCF6094237.1 DMT family transporter [Microaerobacter geothermalis]
MTWYILNASVEIKFLQQQINRVKERKMMPLRLYGVLGLLSLIWGSSFLFIKILLEDFGPWSVASLRSLFGALAIAIIILLQKEKMKLKEIPWGILLIVGLLNSALPWTFIGMGETRISSGMASIANASTPILTMLVGLLLFKISLNSYQWIGMGIGFIGILILVGLDVFTNTDVDRTGILLVMLASLCYAFSSQLSKRYLQSISVSYISMITLFAGAFFSGILALVSEPIHWSNLFITKNFLSFIGLGVVGSGIAYMFFYYIIQEGSAEFATTVTYLVPFTALLWGWLLLGESIFLSAILGLVMILSGVYISGRKTGVLVKSMREARKF